MGIVGCALADNISISFTCISNVIYTYLLDDIKEAVFRPTLESFRVGDFKEQLSISMWSIFNSVVEGYSWQLMILITGYLSVED